MHSWVSSPQGPAVLAAVGYSTEAMCYLGSDRVFRAGVRLGSSWVQKWEGVGQVEEAGFYKVLNFTAYWKDYSVVAFADQCSVCHT